MVRLFLSLRAVKYLWLATGVVGGQLRVWNRPGVVPRPRRHSGVVSMQVRTDATRYNRPHRLQTNGAVTVDPHHRPLNDRVEERGATSRHHAPRKVWVAVVPTRAVDWRRRRRQPRPAPAFNSRCVWNHDGSIRSRTTTTRRVCGTTVDPRPAGNERSEGEQ